MNTQKKVDNISQTYEKENADLNTGIRDKE